MSATADAVVDVDGLTVSYGGRSAVDQVSFRVAAGEVVGFLGPNGAGKTSTIRALLGLLRPDHGRATVRGSVGYLPEGFVGDEALSVRSQLRFLAVAKGVPRASERAAIDGALAAVDLQALARRPVGRLSRGQRQRVGIAQAVLGEPDALLLDEPTAGLDPTQVQSFRRLVQDRAAAGAAVLVSTHILAEAAALCDRIVVVARGRVVAEEEPGAVEALEERFLRLVAETELGVDPAETPDGEPARPSAADQGDAGAEP